MRRPSLQCQVGGCDADLGSLRPYFQRQHICEEHARAEEIPDGRGGFLRFCQQCTKLEPLTAFDGKKRSCQASLVKRHHRRSGGGKRAYAAATSLGGRSGSSGGYVAAGAGNARAVRTTATRQAAAAEERSATSQLTGSEDRSDSASREEHPADTAARSLAALVDAALPDGGEELEAAPAGATDTLVPLELGLLGYDARGSGIVGRPQPVRPQTGSGAPPYKNLGFGLAATFNPTSNQLLPQAPPAPVAQLNGTAWGSLPADVQNAFLSTAQQSVQAPHGSNASAGTADLLPMFASALSSRSVGGAAATAAAARHLAPLTVQASTDLHRSQGLQGLPAAAAHALAPENGRDLQELLSALELLQQLQQMISQCVVAQLQQHQARTEAAALLERQLLPLLAGIQQQLQPADESGGQLQHLVASLNQLSGILQPLPQGADVQALELLKWLQQSGALGAAGVGVGPAPAATASLGQLLDGRAGSVPPAAAPAAAFAQPPSSCPENSEQVQAVLRRVAGLLKRQEELGL